MTQVGRRKKRIAMFSKGRTDITLLFVILFLMVFGIIMIYSSSYYSSYQVFGNHSHYLMRQVTWVILGTIIMYVISKVNYRFILQYTFIYYFVMILLLVVVMALPGDVNGSKRWINIAGGFKLQPSEYAKIVIILTLSGLLERFSKHIDKLRPLGFILFVAGLPILLIGIENLSTAIVILAITGGMIFIIYKNIPKLLAVVIPIIGVLGFIFFKTGGYRSSRVEIWLNGPFTDPLGKGFQTIQSLYAIGSGGFFGVGLGKSIQKIDFIPEAHNDIIFSIICEELGMFGAFSVLLLFGLLIWRCFDIIRTSQAISEILIVAAVMIHIAAQVFINIGVVTNSIPATGIPLPFISYGGSSLIFLLAEIGIVLNIARQNTQRIESV